MAEGGGGLGNSQNLLSFKFHKNNQQIGTMKGIPLQWNGGGRGPRPSLKSS